MVQAADNQFTLENNAPTMLLILDGFGYREQKEGNAIAQANMPTWKSILNDYPSTLLKASGGAVGLLEGFMGNSEVGHVTLGAGRVVRTAFCKFHDSIKDGSFFQNRFLIRKLELLKEKNKAFHIMGLLSDAGVHAHEEQFYALIRLAKQVGLSRVYLHVFLDGRDTPPKSAKTYLDRLQKVIDKERLGVIASLHGRFYSMDRDNNFDRIKKSYDAICGNGVIKEISWEQAIDDSYSSDVTDEFIEPVLINKEGAVSNGDGIFFTNFRPDRARQLSECFLSKSVSDVPSFDSLTFFISTVRYDETFKKYDNDVLFEHQPITNTLLDEIAEQTKSFTAVGARVFIIAETEKYAHVTYFFRGMRDEQLSNETRVLVPSKKVRTYIDYPEMSAPEITQKLLESLRTDPAYFYLVNYANCDMVGHSGDLKATIKACECVDEQLSILYEEVVERLCGTIFLVGDHGNAEEMLDNNTNKKKTSHTNNSVPFVVVNKKLKGKSFFESQCELSNVAPTVLQGLGLQIPKEMNQEK